MVKNNKLINTVKRMAERNRERNISEAVNQIIPAVYASLAIALHNEGFGSEDIEYLFALSQDIWTEHSGNLGAMVKKCEDLTGIEVMYEN